MITPEMLAKSGTEHGEQMALFCWAGMPFQQARYPALQWMYAIPNSGARGNKIAAAQLKAEGVKSGVADVCLPVPQYDKESANPKHVRFCGLYVELKRVNGEVSDVKDKQIAFAKFVIQEGYAWFPCFGWLEAVHIIESYLENRKPHLTAKQQAVFNDMYS